MKLRLTRKFNLDFHMAMEDEKGNLTAVCCALVCERMDRKTRAWLYDTDENGLPLPKGKRYDWSTHEKYSNPDEYLINECIVEFRGRRMDKDKGNQIVPIVYDDDAGEEKTLTTEQFKRWIYSEDPQVLEQFAANYNSHLLTQQINSLKNS